MELHTLLLLILAGFFAGFIDAVAGGGGLLSVPSLLAAGLPPHLALGTNKLAATFSSITSSITFFKKKLFDPAFWRSAVIATAIGAVLGTLAVDSLSTEVLDKTLPVVIFLAAIYSLMAPHGCDKTVDLPQLGRKLRASQWLQGLSLGFYDGLAGPGSGTFWMVSSMALYKMNLLLCCGLARTMTFISNSFSLVAFIVLAKVDFTIGIAMGLSMMIGSFIGAHSAIKFGQRFIRPLFTLVVLAIALKLAIEAWV